MEISKIELYSSGQHGPLWCITFLKKKENEKGSFSDESSMRYYNGGVIVITHVSGSLLLYKMSACGFPLKSESNEVHKYRTISITQPLTKEGNLAYSQNVGYNENYSWRGILVSQALVLDFIDSSIPWEFILW